jgi:hypothetical protein
VVRFSRLGGSSARAIVRVFRRLRVGRLDRLGRRDSEAKQFLRQPLACADPSTARPDATVTAARPARANPVPAPAQSEQAGPEPASRAPSAECSRGLRASCQLPPFGRSGRSWEGRHQVSLRLSEGHHLVRRTRNTLFLQRIRVGTHSWAHQVRRRSVCSGARCGAALSLAENWSACNSTSTNTRTPKNVATCMYCSHTHCPIKKT